MTFGTVWTKNTCIDRPKEFKLLQKRTHSEKNHIAYTKFFLINPDQNINDLSVRAGYNR